MANRIRNVEYMRGLAMFGVVAIHVGAQALTAPALNPHIILVLEVFSRFCVPLFFFVSAFGLFSSHPLGQPISYKQYYLRRAQTVLLPYLIWSLLYIAVMPPITNPDELYDSIPKLLFFGIGAYHLYFMVILIWFYVFFPLWRGLFSLPDAFIFPFMVLAFPLQYCFNQYSTQVFDLASVSEFWQPFFYYRLHTWPLHYLFPFLLGAFAATHKTWWNKTTGQKGFLLALFWLTSAGWLTNDYYTLLANGVSMEAAVNLLQQLSLPGSTFFLASTLLIYRLLAPTRLPKWLQSFFSYLSKHSYAVYLIHPMILTGLDALREANDIPYTSEITLLIYVGTSILAVIAAIMLNVLIRFPVGGALLGKLLLGKK